MGILARSVREIYNATTRTGLTWTDMFTTAPAGSTGISVTEETAIQSSAVFRCVSIIAGVVASLPFGVYRNTGDGSEPATDHPLHPALHDTPSEALTSYTYRHLKLTSLLLWGNGFARIAKKRRRDIDAPVEFLFLPPAKTKVERKAGRLVYTYTDDEGKKEELNPTQVLHVPGLGFDGVKGESVIANAGKEPLGLSFALERMLGALHSNAARPSGIYSQAESLDATALKNLKAAFRDLYEGGDNTGRTIFLDQGAEWKPMSINPVDLETLAARRFQVADIARLFGVPLHFLGETEKATSWGSGLEELTAGFVRYTVRPWLVAIEQEYNRKLRGLDLLADEEFVEFNLEGLLRGDSKARGEFYGSGIQNGWMKPNEARRRENLPPDPAGDVLYANGTLQPLGAGTGAPATPKE
jgi:HK97 family phage portal protein